jgi:cold shock CspA family protein
MKGTIKKLATGYGFIMGEDRKQYFMHHTALDTRETGTVFETLYEGQEVEFEPTTTSKGPRAEQVRLA